jgi:hypothetical protein
VSSRIISMSYLHRNNTQYSADLGEIPYLKAIYEARGKETCHNADIVMLIPKGRRCLLWFTTLGTQNVCYLIDCMHVNGNKHTLIKNGTPSIIHTCFASELSYGSGTILRGTYLRYKGDNLCAIEDVYYHKGVKTQNLSLVQRLSVLQEIFTQDVHQLKYIKNQTMLAMCVMMDSNTLPETIINTVDSLPYQIKFVQYRYDKRSETPVVNVELDNMKNYSVIRNKNIYNQRQPHNSKTRNVEELVFLVKPDLQDDIYHLYTYGDGGEYVFHGYAGIQSYESSVMMNKLFRKIKENDNLDALEESDDEEEFENVDEYKYVKIDTSHRIVCKYMPKINKWLPQRLAHRGHRVATLEQTQGFGKITI